MKLYRLILPSAAGLLMAAGTLAAYAGGQPARTAAPAALATHASETSLLPAGDAQDIHADASGKLWISEIASNTVREVDRATGAYTLYTGLPEPFDAQMGPDGKLWWLEGSPQAIAHMDLSSRAVVTYPVDTERAVALTFDSSQRAWFVDDLAPGIYSFDPSNSHFCDIALPGGIGGPFISEHSGALWLGDWVSSTLGRFTPTTDAYTYWPLAFGGGNPIVNGVTFAANGDVWWADSGLHKLGRLEPGANRLSLYSPPGLYSPQRVAYHAGLVWFTDPFTASVGFVDPATASSIASHVAAPTVTTLSPSCHAVTPGPGLTAGRSTGHASFSSLVLTTTVSAGSTRYQGPPDGWPWALTFVNFDLWATDINRDKLIHLDTAQAHLFLPLVQR